MQEDERDQHPINFLDSYSDRDINSLDTLSDREMKGEQRYAHIRAEERYRLVCNPQKKKKGIPTLEGI